MSTPARSPASPAPPDDRHTGPGHDADLDAPIAGSAAELLDLDLSVPEPAVLSGSLGHVTLAPAGDGGHNDGGDEARPNRGMMRPLMASTTCMADRGGGEEAGMIANAGRGRGKGPAR
jgi:hypothetical protein